MIMESVSSYDCQKRKILDKLQTKYILEENSFIKKKMPYLFTQTN